MPDSEFAAMLSYSRVDREWVEVLHGHLEQCLGKKVFYDQLDVGPGRSWIDALQRGLEKGDRVILVATPESLASPRVADEWQALLASRDDWRQNARLLVARLRPVPLPTFVNCGQHVDFENHDDDKYRQGLLELLGALRGRTDKRRPPELPADLQPPSPPTDPLGADLRTRAEDWLTEYLQGADADFAVAQVFRFGDLNLRDAFPGEQGIASAAIVRATRDEQYPRTALLDRLQRFEGRRRGKLAEDLAALLDELAAPPPVEGLPAAVAAWREHVARDCRDLEAAGPGDPRRRPLETIYVELGVSRRPGEAPDGAEPGALARRGAAKGEGGGADSGRLRMEHLLLPTDAAGAKEPAPRDDSSARSRPRGWVILGDPGSGKTTLLRHLARHFATRPSLDLLPVFVSLPQVMAGPGWFLDDLESRARRLGTRGDLADALDRAGQDADPVPLLILADGLDEVSRERRGDARDWLLALADRLPAARVVVSSRPVPYASLHDDGFEEVVIQPLDEAARLDLVANHLAAGDEPTAEERQRAEKHVEFLRRDAWLWEWAGNPLYLGFLALLLREGVEPSRRRPELYRQVLDLMLRCKHRPGTPGVDAPGPVRELLSVLAYRMTDGNETEVHEEWLERQVVEGEEEIAPVLARLANGSGRYRERPLSVFEDLERTGVLAPYADPDWRFLHRTFREALAAEHLARQATTEEGMAQVLARANALGERSGDRDERERQEADQARWAEPFALLAGQVEDRDGLVLALVGANRELGLRALASTHDLQPATLKALLDQVENNYERAAVIRSLPQVLDSPAVVLDLVDELRRTRNGDDLFWLYWVVQEVEGRAAAEGNRELAGAAEARLGSFFDHIEPPPVEMFQTVETGRFGQRPLWCTIPPEDHAGPGDGVVGSFRMGSPKKEKDRFDWEGPQHRVEFRSRFRLAAVPVTRAQYALFDPDHKSHGFEGVPEEELAHHPVNQVSWWAAASFCRWLSRSVPELAGARLPTEAEWEYACRAGTETAYWKGNGEAALKKVGWYGGNSGGRTHGVGELPANDWGLYDVHGNVDEWTLSPWSDDYSNRQDGKTEDPGRLDVEDLIGIDPGGGGRVIRGGSYAFDARCARSAYRFWRLPWVGFWFRGFRVALPAAPSEPRS